MKITICGSIAFFDAMERAQRELKALGHEVRLPPAKEMDENGRPIPAKEFYAMKKKASADEHWVWERKGEAMRRHFGKVVWADAILVLNHEKNGILHYIGANTLLEMGLAFHHKKKIYLLNPIPEIAYKEEILAMEPLMLNGDLTVIGKEQPTRVSTAAS